MAESTIDRICAGIRSRRFNYADEDRLQEGLAAALAEDGLPVVRERRVFGGRIDILVEHADTVGIEVKTAGTPAEVARQLRRYADGGDLDRLLLVTNRARHRDIDQAAFAIPVHVEVLQAI